MTAPEQPIRPQEQPTPPEPPIAPPRRAATGAPQLCLHDGALLHLPPFGLGGSIQLLLKQCAHCKTIGVVDNDNVIRWATF